MDRVIVYPNALPRVLDILKTGQYGVIGLGKLAEAVLGSSTVADGFTCVPTTPASTSVVLSGGQVYQAANIEASNISALAADTRSIQKQGVVLDAQQITFVPPSIVGQSACALVQVQYFDSDTGSQVLNYYNAANPSVPLVGPSGNKTANTTIRAGAVSVGVKLGNPVTSGLPQPPTPDPGYVGLFVVTLSYGQTQIQAGQIAPYANASTIPVKLPKVPAVAQSGIWKYGVDSGSADNYAVTLNPSTNAPVEGQTIFVKFTNANATTAPTLNVNGSGARPLYLRTGLAPVAGDVAAGWREIFFDGTAYRLTGPAASELKSSAVAAALPFTPAGARRARAFTPGVVLADMTNTSTDYVVQSVTFSGASYAIVTGRCSISNDNASQCNLYAKTKIIRQSDGATIAVSDFLGGVTQGSNTLPMSVVDFYQSLDKNTTYVAQLITSKNNAVGATRVLDAFLLVQTD